jgi:hypothetical protein
MPAACRQQRTCTPCQTLRSRFHPGFCTPCTATDGAWVSRTQKQIHPGLTPLKGCWCC